MEEKEVLACAVPYNAEGKTESDLCRYRSMQFASARVLLNKFQDDGSKDKVLLAKGWSLIIAGLRAYPLGTPLTVAQREHLSLFHEAILDFLWHWREYLECSCYAPADISLVEANTAQAARNLTADGLEDFSPIEEKVLSIATGTCPIYFGNEDVQKEAEDARDHD